MLTELKHKITGMVVAGTVLLPPGLHYAAEGYLDAERYLTSAAYHYKIEALRYVGLQPVPSDKSIDDMIDAAADKHGIKRPLLHALAITESNKSPTAVSHKGAIGPLQVMPFNAKRCGLPHHGKLWDEATNIECGAQILSEELETYDRDIGKALRAYNGGDKCVKAKCSESEAYVVKVMSNVGKEVLR